MVFFMLFDSERVRMQNFKLHVWSTHFKASLAPCVILTATGMFQTTDKSPKKGPSPLPKAPLRTKAVPPVRPLNGFSRHNWRGGDNAERAPREPPRRCARDGCRLTSGEKRRGDFLHKAIFPDCPGKSITVWCLSLSLKMRWAGKELELSVQSHCHAARATEREGHRTRRHSASSGLLATEKHNPPFTQPPVWPSTTGDSSIPLL